MDTLREQVMVNQFVMVSGCTNDQARKYLQSSQWQFEIALSMFFQESTVAVPSECKSCNGTHSHYATCVPTNTPATPPQFPDVFSAFKKLTTSNGDSYSASPKSFSTISPTKVPTHNPQGINIVKRTSAS